MLDSLLRKSEKSGFYLSLTNFLLWFKIPFNRSHHIRIMEVKQEGLTVRLPFIRKNTNHINTMHACALATCCEYAIGLQLTRMFEGSIYRIVLKQIKMEYLRQSATDVTVQFTCNSEEVNTDTQQQIEMHGAATLSFQVSALNTEQKLICIADVTWQVKRWTDVKRKA